MIGDMSAGRRIDPPEEKADPLPNRRYRQTWPFGRAAAAGVTPVGLRPPFVTPAAAHSHPDRRWTSTPARFVAYPVVPGLAKSGMVP